MVKIIGLSGKKGSGKTSIARFLRDNAKQLFGHKAVVIKPLAEPLKRLCIDILGLRPEQVYGTDDEKNTLTRYRWQDLPHFIEIFYRNNGNVPTGYMTAREVVQEVGTGIFRKMYSEIWTDACINGIKQSGADIGIIDDVRFPNEVRAIQAEGGLVFRLPKDISNGADRHASEVSLNQNVFDWNRFDAVVGTEGDSYDYFTRRTVELLVYAGVAKAQSRDDFHRMGL